MSGNRKTRRTANDGRTPRCLTVRKAAGTLGVPPSVIYRAIRLGLLRASSRHGLLVVPEAEVVRLLGGAR
jgi:hypothetical protein